MSHKNVNERQLTTLRRIADGIEPVTSREHHLATTVYALRDRGLVATMWTGGGTWTASITDEGFHGEGPSLDGVGAVHG